MTVKLVTLKMFFENILMTETLDNLSVIEKRSRGKRLSLSVRQDGTVRLSVPRHMTFATARRFMASKEAWIREVWTRLKVRPSRLLEQGGVAEYQKKKEEARKRIIERVGYFEHFYELKSRSLSVRNQRSRFGSCSARGHLSFNYRLIFLPPDLFDYVIVHEVCHLKELNHSPRFWALVAKVIPDYQSKKRQLQAFSREKVS